MKKLFLSITLLLISLPVWSDIIRPPHKSLYQRDQGIIVPLMCLVLFLIANFGIAFYLKKRTK